jgi:hypothetical protein
LPQVLLTAIGFKSSDFETLLEKWVAYDTTPLDTEARRTIEDKEVDPLSKEYVDEELLKYLDDAVLEKMKVENANEDGFEVYKITLVADSDLIDHLGKKLETEESGNKNGASLKTLGASSEKLSDSVKSLSWQINIDKKDYYTRKIVVISDLEIDGLEDASLYLGNSSSIPQNSKAKIAFAAKFGGFGKVIDAKIPDSSLSSQEFLDTLSEIFNKKYGEMFDQAASSGL